MARIAPAAAFADIPVVDLGQGDRINLGVASIIARLGKVAEALGALNAEIRSTGTLPPRLLELVRLRIAFHNQCRSCMSVRYQSAIDDGLRNHFTEDQLVELGLHCAIALGIGRLTATWDVTDDIPDAFRSETDSRVTPWSAAGVVATG